MEETIELGSVFLALKVGFFSLEDFLQYLVNTPVTTKTRTAYSEACKYVHPSTHKLKDESLFVTKKPQYLALYTYYGGKMTKEINHIYVEYISGI